MARDNSFEVFAGMVDPQSVTGHGFKMLTERPTARKSYRTLR